MPRALTLTMITILSLGFAAIAPAPAAFAAVHDGDWTVLVITEKGTCDRGYRYSVNVSNGLIHYRGEAAIDMTGTVTSNGAVKVGIRFGDQGANGTGRLSTTAGAGTWRGSGSGADCAGRWEAERR